MRLAIDHILTSMKLSDRTDQDQRASNQLSRIATECVAEGHDDPKQRNGHQDTARSRPVEYQSTPRTTSLISISPALGTPVATAPSNGLYRS